MSFHFTFIRSRLSTNQRQRLHSLDRHGEHETITVCPTTNETHYSKIIRDTSENTDWITSICTVCVLYMYVFHTSCWIKDMNAVVWHICSVGSSLCVLLAHPHSVFERHSRENRKKCSKQADNELFLRRADAALFVFSDRVSWGLKLLLVCYERHLFLHSFFAFVYT